MAYAMLGETNGPAGFVLAGPRPAAVRLATARAGRTRAAPARGFELISCGVGLLTGCILPRRCARGAVLLARCCAGRVRIGLGTATARTVRARTTLRWMSQRDGVWPAFRIRRSSSGGRSRADHFTTTQSRGRVLHNPRARRAVRRRDAVRVTGTADSGTGGIGYFRFNPVRSLRQVARADRTGHRRRGAGADRPGDARNPMLVPIRRPGVRAELQPLERVRGDVLPARPRLRLLMPRRIGRDEASAASRFSISARRAESRAAASCRRAPRWSSSESPVSG